MLAIFKRRLKVPHSKKLATKKDYNHIAGYRPPKPPVAAVLAAIGLTLILAYAVFGDPDDGPLIPKLGAPTISASTVPANGDINPYGVAFVPEGFARGGPLQYGDVLVSNFNASSNLQGTGTTIVSVSPSGTVSTFFQGKAGLGLTTALGLLKSGYVLVGNVPSTDGTSATVSQGSLIILDRWGREVANFTDKKFLDGPWYLTVNDFGNFAQVYVSNVLSGTVTRIDLSFDFRGRNVGLNATTIASGYTHRPDPAALEVGPTGLVYDRDNDVLYVASTGDNAIYAVSHAGERFSNAGKGTLIYTDNSHLRGPLALAAGPDGDLLTANGDAVNGDPNFPSEIVEFTKSGQFVAQFSVDAGGQGGAFGIATEEENDKVRFAAVDDIINALDVWNITER